MLEEHSQTNEHAATPGPSHPSFENLQSLVTRKLDDLDIKTVVVVDEYEPGLPPARWAEFIGAIREADQALLQAIELLVVKHGTGNIEDPPSPEVLPQIVSVIAASTCDAAKAMLSQPGSEHELAILEGYLRELKLDVKTFRKVEGVPKDEKLYFIDFRMGRDPETQGSDASLLLSEIISTLAESGDMPGAVLMSRTQNERPTSIDLERIAREGGGFLRSNFRYLDKTEMLPSKQRFFFLLYDLLDSLHLGGKYFAHVRALRKAAQDIVAKVAEETCGLLPADFRLFAETAGGTGPEQRARIGDHLLTIFTGLLGAELRNDKNTQSSLDAFFETLMEKPGMAPGEVGSHTLHRIHSRLLYDQSDWIKSAPTAFGDIYECSRDKNAFYIVITPECDLEPQLEKGVRVAPKANVVVLLRGYLWDERLRDKNRNDVIVTPLVVDPQTDKVRWIYWELRAPSIVPLARLAPGRGRYRKWGRLRSQEAEEIQMRYATDILAVGTEDLPDRVEKRKAVLSQQKKGIWSRENDGTFHVMEIVNPKNPKEIHWALSEGCEHFLCSDVDPAVPAGVVVKLRAYQSRGDFKNLLQSHGIAIHEPQPAAVARQRDVETAEGEVGPVAIFTDLAAAQSADIEFRRSRPKPTSWKAGGPIDRAEAEKLSEGQEVAQRSSQSSDLPETRQVAPATENPPNWGAKEPNVTSEQPTQPEAQPATQPTTSSPDKPEKDSHLSTGH